MRDELNRTDILERAALDAIGLLTPQEVDDLEAELTQADPQLLDEVRQVREGTQVFRETLPPVEPEPVLRTRVMAAVAQMIQQDLRESVQEVHSQRMYLHAGNGRWDWLEPLIAGRVSPLWRMSALIAATVAIAFSWWSYQLLDTNKLLTRYVIEQDAQELLGKLEAHFGDRPQNLIFSPKSENIYFERDGSALAGIARMWYAPDSGNGLIVAKNLPMKADPYLLCLRAYDPTGQGGMANLMPVAEMQSDGNTMAVSFNVRGDLAVGASWCVLQPVETVDGVADLATDPAQQIVWISRMNDESEKLPYRLILRSTA